MKKVSIYTLSTCPWCRKTKKFFAGPVGGGVITYMLAGKQYVAVAAGMNNPIMKTKSGPARVAIFALH